MESLPDFQKLIEAYGFTALRVETLDELEPALERAFADTNELVFLDVIVDPHEHVYPMHVPLGAMRDMLLSKTERT
jgi:acetolactate synthase-1/2/3 large subunit